MQQPGQLAGSMTDAGCTFVTVSELLAAGGRDTQAEFPGGPRLDSS